MNSGHRCHRSTASMLLAGTSSMMVHTAGTKLSLLHATQTARVPRCIVQAETGFAVHKAQCSIADQYMNSLNSGSTLWPQVLLYSSSRCDAGDMPLSAITCSCFKKWPSS